MTGMATGMATGTARVSADGLLRFRGETHRVALGHGGVTADKREGDGATPLGVLPLRRVLYRADRLGRPPRASVPVEPLSPTDGWCDAPDDAAYNRRVTRPYAAHHEALWRDDALYTVLGVLGWNDAPVIAGRGSAIFLHVARPDLAPTEGCVALHLAPLLVLLAAGLDAVEVVG